MSENEEPVETTSVEDAIAEAVRALDAPSDAGRAHDELESGEEVYHAHIDPSKPPCPPEFPYA